MEKSESSELDMVNLASGRASGTSHQRTIRLDKWLHNSLLLGHHPQPFPSLTSTSNSADRPGWFHFQNLSVTLPSFLLQHLLLQTTGTSVCFALFLCKMEIGTLFPLRGCCEPSIG